MGMKGGRKHTDRLRKLGGPDAVRIVSAIVHEGADMIRAEAFRLISAGSVSGKNHKPSAPGSPPNRDTGVLQANLETRNKRNLRAEVVSKAPYAAIQEFGGTIKHPGGTPYFMRNGKPVFVSKSGAGAFHGLPTTEPHDITLPARPYMRPARDAKAKEIRKRMAEQMNKLVKRSG